MRLDKQTRSRPTSFRALEEDGEKRIEGYFAVFDGVYEVNPWWSESIDHEAFDGALEDDIRALIDHETRLVLGRTSSGTLTLRVDDKGLWGSISVNEDDQDAMNLYARVKRGDVSQCSFGFDILEEDREVDEATGHAHYTIKRVKLYEVSVVTFPAYEDTGVTARAKDCQALRAEKLRRWKEETKRRLKHGA